MDMNFRAVPLDPLLVFVGTGFYFPFYKDLRPFAAEITDDFCLPPPKYEAVPFGLLGGVTRSILVSLISCETHGGNGGVTAVVAVENPEIRLGSRVSD